MPSPHNARAHLLARRVHDAYRSLLGFLRVPLRKQEISSSACVENLGEVQAAGEAVLDNSLEAEFYGLPDRTVRRAWPAGNLYRIRDAAVVGELGQVFTGDGTLLATPPNAYTEPDHKVRRPIRTGARRIQGAVFHLTGPAPQSRAHFCLQSLPRLLAARRLLGEQPRMRVLVPCGQRAWHCEFLDRLSIGPERVVENTPGTVLAGELFFVPPLFGEDQLCAPQSCDAVGAMWPGREGRGRVLFISRRDAPSRRLLNEDEILEATREVLGEVERVELSGMPPGEQAALFKSARWIIGPHGQAMFNGVFTARAVMVDLSGCPVLPGEATWQAAYRNLILMRGGRAVRLVSGLPDAGTADWHFPVERYRAQIARVGELAVDTATGGL